MPRRNRLNVMALKSKVTMPLKSKNSEEKTAVRATEIQSAVLDKGLCYSGRLESCVRRGTVMFISTCRGSLDSEEPYPVLYGAPSTKW